MVRRAAENLRRIGRSRPFPYWFEGDSCRRLSGLGKSGIGARSETCEQFRELGVQSIAARRGERVKRKKRHVGVLGQRVILRRNSRQCLQSFGRRATPSLRFLLLNQKNARAADAVLVSISRQEAEFVRRSLGLPVVQVTEVSDL